MIFSCRICIIRYTLLLFGENITLVDECLCETRTGGDLLKLFLWILFIFVIFICLLFLDFYFGRRQHLKEIDSFHFPIRYSNMEIFTNGTNLFQQTVRDIKGANHHIHILFYIFRDDPFGSLMLELLEKKRAEGVQVRLLIDWVGSLYFPRRRIKELRKRGIEISFCHVPSFPFLLYKLQSRNHRKIMVIDGKIGFLGGFNIGKEYVNRDEVLNPWRDCHVRFTGEGVQDLQKQFLTDWRKAGNHFIEHADYYPHLEKGDIKHQFFTYEGTGLEEDICHLLDSAKEQVIIGSPYFIPGKKAFLQLKQCIKRGVDVTIIVPGISDHPLIKEGSFRYLRKLLQLGCTVYHYQEGFYHAKVFIIDQDLCSIGTANFDKRSFYYNYEMNSIFYDKNITKQMLDIANRDIAKSSPVTLKKLYPKKVSAVVKEWIAFVISPLL